MTDKKEEERLIAFIEHHKEFMTCQDMAEEAGVPYGKISYLAKKMGAELLSVAERNKNFIREKIGIMEKSRIRKALDVGEVQFEALYRQMGLTHEDFTVKDKVGKPWKSPREVMREGFPLSIGLQEKSRHAFDQLLNSCNTRSSSKVELEMLAAESE